MGTVNLHELNNFCRNVILLPQRVHCKHAFARSVALSVGEQSLLCIWAVPELAARYAPDRACDDEPEHRIVVGNVRMFPHSSLKRKKKKEKGMNVPE